MKTQLRSAAALAMLVLATAAGAADQAASQDPMAGWAPPKVKQEAKDRKEIQALFREMEAAGKKGDLEAAAALIDFPVLMVTDDKRGEAGGESWSREQWMKVMAPFYAKPMEGTMTHKPAIFMVTDSLATANVEWTMKERGKTMSGRNAMILVRKGGAWKAKVMMEGGWGDMPVPGDEAPATR